MVVTTVGVRVFFSSQETQVRLFSWKHHLSKPLFDCTPRDQRAFYRSLARLCAPRGRCVRARVFLRGGPPRAGRRCPGRAKKSFSPQDTRYSPRGWVERRRHYNQGSILDYAVP